MNKTINLPWIGILALFVFFIAIPKINASEILANGEYEASIKAIRMDNDNDSTVNERLINPASLVVDNNSIKVTFETNESLQLSLVQNDDTVVPLDELGDNTYSFTVEGIKLDSETQSFTTNMQIFVPQAPVFVQNQKFRFLLSDFKLINAIENEDEGETDDTGTPFTDNSDTQNQTEDQQNNHEQDQETELDSTIDVTKKDGKYTVTVAAVKTSDGTRSIMEDRLINPAILEFINDKVYAYVTFDTILNDAKIKNENGEFVPLELHQGTTYKFELDRDNLEAVIQIFVPEANITVDFKLIFDQSTFKKLAEYESIPDSTESNTQVTSQTTNQVTKVENPKTSDSFSISYLMIGFILLISITYSLKLKQRKVAN